MAGGAYTGAAAGQPRGIWSAMTLTMAGMLYYRAEEQSLGLVHGIVTGLLVLVQHRVPGERIRWWWSGTQ